MSEDTTAGTERRLESQLATMSAQNDRLVRTLKDARAQIVSLKSEVDRLAQPPAAYGLVLEVFDGGLADILTGGRKMHVAVSPTVDPAELAPGREVRLNEALNIVATCGFEPVGEVVLVKELLDDGRVLVVARADEERVCRLAQPLLEAPIRVGDALLLESRSGFVPPSGTVPGAQTQATQGRPAVWAAWLREDDDRQGRRRFPGSESCREGGQAAGEVLFPQH